MLTKLLIGLIISLTIFSSYKTTEPIIEEPATLSVFSQDTSEAELSECAYTRLSFDESEPATEMVAVSRYLGEDTMSGSLSGLIDTNGKVIVPLIYDVTWDSSEGYSIVGIKIENADKDYYDPFGNLLDEENLDFSNTVYTYVNIKGEEYFGYYSDVQSFSEGIAFVKGAEDNWYALDKSGNITKLDESISWIEGFKEGMAVFGSKTDNKVGFINRDFEIVIPAVCSSASGFSEGLAAVADPNENLIYIDKSGNTILETDYDYYSVSYDTMRFFKDSIDSYSFHEGVAFLPKVRSKTATSNYYIDKSGNIVINNVYGSTFSQGLAPAMDENGNVGFIDKTGTFVIPAQYHSASSFNEYGTAFVYSHEYLPEELYTYEDYYENYCGCINTKGEVVIPLEYYCNDDLHGFPDISNGIFKLHKDGYIHYFKSDGTLIGKIEAAKGAVELYESLKR